MTLVPSPKRMRVHRGELDLRGMQIVMNTACDARIFKACKTLADELESLTGAFSKINKAFDPASCGVCVSVCAGTKKNVESYTLAVDGNGVKIALSTADTMKEVRDISTQTADLISEIAAASKEQNNSIIQITQGVSQISDVIQRNSATAEESAASCKELSGQSKKLKQQVARFRVRN